MGRNEEIWLLGMRMICVGNFVVFWLLFQVAYLCILCQLKADCSKQLDVQIFIVYLDSDFLMAFIFRVSRKEAKCI